jgi:5-methylcytosine-specific restriction endonuclease McrA
MAMILSGWCHPVDLHFDHDIPFSKGGSSLTAANVRLLCAKHNLEKSDKILSIAPWVLVGAAAAPTSAWFYR